MMTLKQALLWASQLLASKTASPALDARLLLMHVTQLSQVALITQGEQKLTATQRAYFEELVDKRSQGIPIAYLLGQQFFWSLEFVVTPDVLIPRPETECLVEWIINQWGDQNNFTVLDLGTGSGAIALALACERPNWDVIGSDVSVAAVKLAQYNARLNQLNHVSWVVSDWLAAYKSKPCFDIIVSNPPYVASNDPHDQTSGYEPEQALLALDNGLADIDHLAQTARAYLKPGGCLLMEHGSEQGQAVRNTLRENCWRQVATLKDLAGLERASWGYER